VPTYVTDAFKAGRWPRVDNEYLLLVVACSKEKIASAVISEKIATAQVAKSTKAYNNFTVFTCKPAVQTATMYSITAFSY